MASQKSARKSKAIPASRGVQSMVPGKKAFDAAGDKVWAAMELRSWGISDLAKACGVSRVTLSWWLNGQRPLRADYLLAILTALELEILPRPSRGA